MKKAKIILLSLLAMTVTLFAYAGTSYAGSFHSGDTVTTGKNEVINHTLFVAGKNIEINGTVKGDVFCAGQNITINAKVDGDVICAGMNVDIRGTVTGDVRAAGQVVTVEAKVDHSASLAGSSVRVGSDATIEKDLQIAGSTSTVEGTVGRDVDAAGSSVAISGMVGGDVQATTDTLQLGSDAKINGNVTYYSHNIVSKTANTHINGKITRKEPPVDHEQRNQSPVLGIVFSFFALLSLAFVSLALFPRKLQALTDLALTQPGMTVLIGLAACIGVPALILVSFMTVIGVMVGIVLLLAWVGIMLLSGIFASYYVGRLILMRTSPQHPFVAMLVGVAILSALLLIPIVNVIALVMTALFGSGMVVRELFAKSPTPRYGHLSHPQRKKQAKA